MAGGPAWRGHAWQGENVWQGACMAGGGHAWQGVCVAGGHAWHAHPACGQNDRYV